MTNTELLIKNITQIIRAKGMKQCVVAEKAGLKAYALSAMLHGRKTITAEHIPNIACALEVSVDELYKKRGE